MFTPFNEQKFKELVLHLAEKCTHDSNCGATKLNKLLFFSDFTAYALLGKPITGAEYIKLPHGPAPKFMAHIRAEMEMQEEVRVARGQSFGYPQDRVIPRRPADLSSFEAAELAIVGEMVSEFWSDTATQVSDLTHKFPGWLVAAPREVIPYEAIFLSDESASCNDRQWALEQTVKNGW